MSVAITRGKDECLKIAKRKDCQVVKYNIAKLTMLFILFGMLSGCFFKSGKDLYALPQPPEEYVELQRVIENVLNGGAEYAAPVSGGNRQSVQVRDLDGDGVEEAIAFFRSDDEKPLKIYIFKLIGEVYELVIKIEGDGASIDSVYFSDLNQDGMNEVVVGWMMSNDITKVLSVYSLKDWEAEEIYQCGYSEYTLFDFDSDGALELLALRHDGVNLTGTAELVNFTESGAASSAAQMSKGTNSILRIISGYLQDGVPAVFVASYYGSSNVVTDIFAMKNEAICNITLDEWTDVSVETVRSYGTYATDIDRDGAMELPQPVQMPSYESDDTAEKYWRIIWRSFYLSGSPRVKMVTYHNYTDGWYFRLPESWADEITVKRSDSVSGEKTVTFMIWRGEDLEPLPIMRIYALTGYNRVERATLGNRKFLTTSGESLYAYEFLSAYSGWEHALSAEEVESRFHLIISEWNMGIMS